MGLCFGGIASTFAKLVKIIPKLKVLSKIGPIAGVILGYFGIKDSLDNGHGAQAIFRTVLTLPSVVGSAGVLKDVKLPKFGNKNSKYSIGDATFMDSDDAFLKNISNRTDIDANGYFDVIAHGTPNGIQITHNGQKIIVNSRIAARLIQNMAGYNGQPIRLLSCSTGSLDNGFAQNLANKLNVEVYAPTNFLWATPNGTYFVAGKTKVGAPDMNIKGIFKLFKPGGNQ